MNRLSLLVATFSILLFASCGKIKKAIQLDLDMQSSDVSFTIPIISQTGEVTIDDVNVALNVDSIIKANNADLAAKNIRSVTLKSCTINMLDGDANNNFSALQACKVAFSSNQNSNVITVAEISNNPDTEAYTLDFPVNTTVNFKDYFQATTFSYLLSGNARKTTTKEIQCKATIKYTVNVGL